MAKRKKHPKLPNGFGSVRYLGEGRRNPYAVHPPVKEFTEDGIAITPKALCYVNDWYVGVSVLMAYRAGTYQPGDELQIAADMGKPTQSGAFFQRVLADYSQAIGAKSKENNTTFAEVYERWYKAKFIDDELNTVGPGNYKFAFIRCKSIHDIPIRDLTTDSLQEVINSYPGSQGSKAKMVVLIKQMFRYAIAQDIIKRDYSDGIAVKNGRPEKNGHPFTEDDLAFFWENNDDPIAEMILIMCYSGFRIKAYYTLEINLDNGFFYGGIKTAAGKNRYVPIHSAIAPLVKRRLERYGALIPYTDRYFRIRMKRYLAENGIAENGPHGCRHTFSWLCEHFRVNENDRKRMLGHSFGSDITNAVYGHRTLEELRAEIEKIKAPAACDEPVTNRFDLTPFLTEQIDTISNG